MAFDFIKEQLALRQQAHQHRSVVPITGKQSRHVVVAGKKYLNFCSNDYLGLTAELALVKAWQKGAALFGVGSGGSYLVSGYNQVHHDVTQQLKEWLGVEDIALFSSGYSANQAMIKLLLSRNDLLIQDKLNHASLMEAGQYSAAKMQRFKHNDMHHLETILQNNREIKNKLVISEGVFSMDGDMSPIQAMKAHCMKHNAWLMIDDAHGLGVLGKQGAGSVVEQNMENKALDIYMATFGKALGVGGAFVAGSTTFIDYLTNFSKPYIYTTGLPPAMVYCIGEAACLVVKEQWRRDQLLASIAYFKQLAKQQDIPLLASESAIQPVLIGSSELAVTVSERLKQQGIWVKAIRPPTVPKQTARLRITLTALHQKEDIQRLVTGISEVLNGQ